MGRECKIGIIKALNKTNFKVLAWYWNQKESEADGLKHVKMIHKMPMQSTGGQNFSVYIFIKTKSHTKQNDKKRLRETVN
jgi:hypothetical protein